MNIRLECFWLDYEKNCKVPDLSFLSPCSSALKKHTSRAHYVAKSVEAICSPTPNCRFIWKLWLVGWCIGWLNWCGLSWRPRISICWSKYRYPGRWWRGDDDNLEGDKEDVPEDFVKKSYSDPCLLSALLLYFLQTPFLENKIWLFCQAVRVSLITSIVW